MAKTWVLHTETKGTGAQMVPLERTTKRSSSAEPLSVPRKPRPRAEPEPAPRAPRRFKVVDVMSGRELASRIGTREALDVLEGFRSIVDVYVYVWQEERDRWRLLTFGEQRVLWDLAHA